MNFNNEIYLIFTIKSNPNIKEITKQKDNQSTITYQILYKLKEQDKRWIIFIPKKQHKTILKNEKIIGLKLNLSVIYQFIEKLPNSLKYITG